MEQDAWLTSELTAEKDVGAGYKWFMRNEPREKDSDIEVEPETGWRFQWWKVGMVRNAKDEDKKRMKVFLDPIPHTIIDTGKPLQGWYKSKFEPPNVRARPCFTDAILTQPYGGYCHVGCAFCYINHGFRGYRGQGLTTVPMRYGEEVRGQIARMRTSAAGYFSSFTDPFLPLEEFYQNTRSGAEAFADAGLPVFFLSRLRYPDWAFDVLRRSPYSYAQMSINTPDPDDWKRLSPNALPLPDMIDQVTALHNAGIYVSIQVNPIIAGVTTNEEIVELIHTLAAAGADHLIFKFVEISYSSAGSLVEIMKRRFGDNRGGVFGSLFTCNIGSERTIDEEYRLAALDLFSRECKKAGVTMATCYEYRYQRGATGDIVNKTGVSVGRDYLTADQCHGHRVPLFTRPTPSAPFEEVKACPPTGCLSCADDNGGAPRCGNELFGQAKALRASDLRVPVYTKRED